MESIAIIKLGALGDVVRTLPILLGIKEKFPESNITWITKENAKDIVSSSKHVDRVLTLPTKVKENFDILYNFDVEDDATKLASEIESKKKYGFYKDGDYVSAFNFSAEYYLNTIFDDELKKSNKKTYQQMMFDAAELPYKKQHHPINLSEPDKKYAQKFSKDNKIDQEKLIGIHVGASSKRWPSKSWSDEKIKEFIVKLSKKGYETLIFAGPNDKTKQEEIYHELKSKGIKVYKNDPENTINQFASLVNLCQKMVCFDSLALHIALSLGKPTCALFFCTSPDEVESYGILNKIVSPMLCDFFPEKMDVYSEELVNSISIDKVLDAITNP